MSMIGSRWLLLTVGVSATLAFPAADVLGLDYSVQYYQGNSHATLVAGSGAASYTLDNLPLVLTSPANVNVGGAIYNYSGEGLYRVYNASNALVRQTLVYGGDYWQFAGHLSRIHLHSHFDDGKSSSELTSLARQGMIHLTCTSISDYASSQLAAVGLTTRRVQSLTLDPWNGYDDGHSLIEIRDPTENRWVLYDVEIGTFANNGGHRLNLFDTTTLYRSDCQAQIEILNANSLYDPNETYVDPTAAYLKLNHDVPTIHASYGRVLQVPIIGGYFAANNQAEADRVKSYPGYGSYTWLTPVEFRQMFYTGEPTYVPEPAATMLLAGALLSLCCYALVRQVCCPRSWTRMNILCAPATRAVAQDIRLDCKKRSRNCRKRYLSSQRPINYYGDCGLDSRCIRCDAP
jgi:hypothetical protein